MGTDIPEAVIAAAAEAIMDAQNTNDGEAERWEAANLARAALEAAAPLIAEAAGSATVVTEWGVRYRLGSVEQIDNDGTDEAGARRGAAGVYARLGGTLVRRTVTYGPWTEVPPEVEEKP